MGLNRTSKLNITRNNDHADKWGIIGKDHGRGVVWTVKNSLATLRRCSSIADNSHYFDVRRRIFRRRGLDVVQRHFELKRSRARARVLCTIFRCPETHVDNATVERKGFGRMDVSAKKWFMYVCLCTYRRWTACALLYASRYSDTRVFANRKSIVKHYQARKSFRVWHARRVGVVAQFVYAPTQFFRTRSLSFHDFNMTCVFRRFISNDHPIMTTVFFRLLFITVQR